MFRVRVGGVGYVGEGLKKKKRKNRWYGWQRKRKTFFVKRSSCSRSADGGNLRTKKRAKSFSKDHRGKYIYNNKKECHEPWTQSWSTSPNPPKVAHQTRMQVYSCLHIPSPNRYPWILSIRWRSPRLQQVHMLLWRSCILSLVSWLKEMC